MFAFLMSLFTLIASTYKNEKKTSIEYNKREKHICQISGLVARDIFEHTLYTFRPDYTEKEKEEMANRNIEFISSELEFIELLVEYYEIMCCETENDSCKNTKLAKQGELLIGQSIQFCTTFHNFKDEFREDTREKSSNRSMAIGKILKTITKNIAEFVKNKGGSRLLKELNLLVSVYKYRRIELEHLLKNIDFELLWELRNRIDRIEQFISNNQDVFVKGVSIRDSINSLDIKLV